MTSYSAFAQLDLKPIGNCKKGFTHLIDGQITVAGQFFRNFFSESGAVIFWIFSSSGWSYRFLKLGSEILKAGKSGYRKNVRKMEHFFDNRYKWGLKAEGGKIQTNVRSYWRFYWKTVVIRIGSDQKVFSLLLSFFDL